MKKNVLSALVTLAALAAAVSAHAGSVSANATVSVNYSGACTLAVANPTVSYAGEDTSATANVTVNCTTGLPYALTADGGQSAQGELRRAQSGSDFIAYRLFKDSGLAQEVGVTTNTVATGTGTGSEQTVSPYYAVKLADNGSAATGTYADTLGYTLTF